MNATPSESNSFMAARTRSCSFSRRPNASARSGSNSSKVFPWRTAFGDVFPEDLEGDGALTFARPGELGHPSRRALHTDVQRLDLDSGPLRDRIPFRIELRRKAGPLAEFLERVRGLGRFFHQDAREPDTDGAERRREQRQGLEDRPHGRADSADSLRRTGRRTPREFKRLPCDVAELREVGRNAGRDLDIKSLAFMVISRTRLSFAILLPRQLFVTLR